jgi:hypothetical protein
MGELVRARDEQVRNAQRRLAAGDRPGGDGALASVRRAVTRLRRR